MRIAIALILALHGLIHLMGFVKAFRPSAIARMTRPMAKPAGLIWLLTCLLLVAGGITYLAKIRLCWLPIGTGMIISQILIVRNWQDAKAGTFVNMLLLPVTLTSFGVWHFERQTDQAVAALLGNYSAHRPADDPLPPLPSLVQFWLYQTGASEKPNIRHVMVRQAGEMKTSPDGAWRRFTATHRAGYDQPGFVWHARLDAGPGLHVAIRDQLLNGNGSMLAKIQSLIALDQVTGMEIDEAAMQRYLAEMVWMPSFAASPYIRWEQLDNVRAKATMNYAGKEASVIFTFNAAGMIKKCEAVRFYYDKSAPAKVPWVVNMDEGSYQSFEGILVPAKSTITWQLEQGSYTWLSMEILDIKTVL